MLSSQNLNMYLHASLSNLASFSFIEGTILLVWHSGSTFLLTNQSINISLILPQH